MSAQFQNENISVELYPSKQSVLLKVKVPEHLVGTENCPQTLQFLQENCATVLDTKCFNPKNLAFRDEVVRTETAHLLEHLILDLMVQEKAAAGAKESASFKGVTRWNWGKDPVGSFDVTLEVPENDQQLVKLVMPRAIKLVSQLFAKKTWAVEAAHVSKILRSVKD